MSYKILTSNKFDKSFKKCVKRGLDIAKFGKVVSFLREEGSLPSLYRPHKLSGTYEGYWECHIHTDWLLIWEQNDNELTLLFIDTGTHSDLFR